MTTLTATLDTVNAAVVLVVDAAPAGPVILTRTDANGTGTVRLREGQEPITGDMVVVDAEAALTGLLAYTCRDANGGTSTASTTFDGSALSDEPRLHTVQLPQVFTSPPYVTGYAASRESTSTVHHVIGREDPLVIVQGVTRMRAGRLETRHRTYADAAASASVLSSGPVLFRQTGHPGLGMYLVATRVALDPLEQGRDGWHWQVAADYVETRSPVLPLLGAAGWSYADLTASSLSYAAVLADFADYAAVVVGP